MPRAHGWIRLVGIIMAAGLLLAMAFMMARGIGFDLAGSQAAPPDDAIHVGGTADYLLDFGDIDIVDATTLPAILARMQPSIGTIPGVGLRHYAGGKLWLRFDVPSLNTAETDWVIRLNNTRVREARLIIIKDGALHQHDWAFDDPVRKAGLSNRMPAFSFDRSEIDGANVLLGFSSLGAMRGTVTLETERSVAAYEMRQAVMFGLLAGFLLALAIYLLVIGGRLGERSLIHAGGLAFFAGTFIFGAGGYIHAVLLPAFPRLADVLLYGTQPVMMTFWVLLVFSYLDLARRNPRLGAVVFTIAMLLPLQGVLTVATGLGLPVPFITDNATPVLIGLVTGLAPAIWYAFRGDDRARRLLACFTPVVLFTLVRAVNYLTPSPNPAFVGIFDSYLDIVLTMTLLAILVVLDIQRREAALRQRAQRNEQRFRHYAEIASDSYFEADADGEIISSAGRMTRDYGLVEGARLDQALALRLGGDAEAVVAQFQAAFGGGRALRDLEVEAIGPGGQPAWLSFNLMPRSTGDGAGLRGTLTDVTERVQRRQREARQTTLSALGQLASGVAHEVNNLLHPMVNLAQRVRDKHTSDEEARKLLDLVVASGKHAGEIVAGVLNSFNPIRIPGEQTSIDQALTTALQTVRATVPATIVLSESIASVDDVRVPPGEMLQVVSNLLSNAIRAMDGAGRISVALAAGDAGGARLVFVDNGPGMPEAIRRRAAEPFVTGRADGTGLGLSVVANIVRNWHGELEIDSAPGQGTRMTIIVAADPPHPRGRHVATRHPDR